MIFTVYNRLKIILFVLLLSFLMAVLSIYLLSGTYAKVERERDMRYMEDIVSSLDAVGGELGYTLCGWIVSEERYHVNNLDMAAAKVIAKDIGGIAIHLTYNDNVDDIAFMNTADESMKEWLLNYFADKNVINTLMWSNNSKYPPYFVTLPDGRVCRIGFAHVNYWPLAAMSTAKQRQDFLSTNKNNGCIVLSNLDEYWIGRMSTRIRSDKVEILTYVNNKEEIEQVAADGFIYHNKLLGDLKANFTDREHLYLLMNDIKGQPSFAIKIRLPNEILAENQVDTNKRNFLFLVIILGFVLPVAVIVFLNRDIFHYCYTWIYRKGKK